ncbi:MAG: cytochrome c-type biogenesis protein CcmH [Gammaproteobacteria bacterium]|jgi:cytochrome c-type biogenesis protein CcmH|nr:cytochrome c-type biogenesis protein CcmH [Gammaproteobacteria bacterium]
MCKWLCPLWLTLLISLSTPSVAAIETYQFASPQLADRFNALTEELRCPKCQNQNLADSDSIISKDLRRQVKLMVDAGQSDDQIRAFMVQRYGDFILYDPPFKTQTLVLWLAPVVLVIIGVMVVIFMRRGKVTASVALNDQERAKLDALIKQQKENSE